MIIGYEAFRKRFMGVLLGEWEKMKGGEEYKGTVTFPLENTAPPPRAYRYPHF